MPLTHEISHQKPNILTKRFNKNKQKLYSTKIHIQI